MIALCILLPILLMLAALWYATRLVYRKTFYMSEERKQNADPYSLPMGLDKPDPGMREAIRRFIERPFEEVTITARDGTLLFARYYHLADGAPLEILCHGYRGVAVRELCAYNTLATELGHNILLIDQRATGRSGGNTVTFGIRERFDILDWVDYAIARFKDTPILLGGVSMGGAAVIMAGGEQLPGAVRGIIADCPYSTPADIIKSVIAMMGLPPRPAFLMVRLAARIHGGFSLFESTALAAIGRVKVPTLILHGDRDRIVPCEMGRVLAEASGGRATLHTFRGADHGMAFMSDPERYRRILFDFVADCLA